MMDHDRNLVFAILAVQLKGVSPSAVVEAGAVWATAPSRSLGELLVERGALREDDRVLLERLVEEAVQAHAGDSAQTLETFGGQEQVDKAFMGTLHVVSEDNIKTIHVAKPAYRELQEQELSAVIETPGRYSHISEHGRGGMGRVLLVHDEHLGRDIALKELLVPGMTPGAEGTPVRQALAITARFLQEARLTGQLEHPSIVPVYELGRRQDGSLYYTMKLVRGKSLFKAIKDCANLAERLALLPHFIDLCNAIAYAHSRGIIHRDIKPDNVMVGEFGETVVLDWGIAKALGRTDYNEDRIKETLLHLNLDEKVASAKTVDGAVLGTPNYMPPEQADGRVDAIDQRSDIYSLGAVLYELLAGKPPFAGDRPSVILKHVIVDEPPSVLSIEPEAPPELEVICRTAMRKEPAARYQTAKELAAEVIRFQTGAFVKAYTYKVSEVLRRYYQRHRAVVNTAVAGVCALVLLGIYSYVSVSRAYVREQEQHQAASEGKYTTQVHLASAYMANSNYDLARRTLWTTEEAYRNWEWGYLVNRCNAELTTLSDHVGATYSPDGTRIATISRNKPVEIYDAIQGQLVLSITEHVDRPLDIRYSPDGALLAAPSLDRTIEVWNAQTGQLLHVLSGATKGITQIAFAPTEKRLAAASMDGLIRIWDLGSGQLEKSFTAHGGAAAHLAYSPDGAKLVSAGRRGAEGTPDASFNEIKVWNLADGSQLMAAPGAMAVWNAQSTQIAAASQLTVTVYDTASGQVVQAFDDHDGYIRAVRITPDAKRVLTASDDGNARVFDLANGALTLTLNYGSPVTDVLPSPNGKYILTTSRNGTMKLWDAATGRLLNTLSGHASFVRTMEFSPDSAYVVSGSFDQTVKIWSAVDSLGSNTPVIYDHAMRASTLSPDGTEAAMLLPNKTVEIRKTDNGAPAGAFASYSYMGGTAAAISPDNRRLVSVLDGFTPLVWDIGSGVLISKLAGHKGSVESAAFSPDGGQILTTSWDNTAKVWNAESGAESFGLAGHTDSVVCGAFSGDGSRVATGSADHTVRIWNARGGQLLQTLQGHTGKVAAVAFDGSGRLASGSADKTIRVWNAESGQCIHVLEGHSHTVGSVAFSPDGSRFVSGSLEGEIKVWNTQTGKELVTLQGHTGAIIRVAFATEALDALSTSFDGTLRRWRAAPWQMASWPGSPQMDISDRFKLYRKTQRPPAAPPDGELTQVYVATTPENSRDALARLTAPIAKAAAPITADGDIYNALASLCVLRGDELTAINETPLAAGESAPQAVTALSQRLSADPAAAWTLTLRRQGKAITYRIAPTQQVEQNLESELPREDARKFLEAQEDRLRRFADNTLEQSRLRATDIGAPVSGPNGLSGIWLSDGEAVEALKPYYLAIGVATGDRVTQINGQPVTDYAALARQVHDLSAAVTHGEPLSLTLEVERGRFVRNHIRVAVR